jgi:tight adherence protein C
MELPALIVGIVILLTILFVRMRTIGKIQSRLGSIDEEPEEPPVVTDPASGWLSGWLYLAGFRSPNAAAVFVTITVAILVLGGFAMWQFHASGIPQQGADLLRSIPGGVGNVMVPFALAMPWLLLLMLVMVPVLVVRQFRKRRVEQVEVDLPLTLDLLNTLAQSGIGFDAALDRIIAAQPADRVLVQELRTFQYDNLAGRPRVDSLRRLARRLQVPAFSTFISAIIQAEQVGAGIAQTLRVQAAEFRSRRREKAAAAALSVPSKMILPMVIGFLPGVFVALLGPMLYQAMQMMGQTLRGIGGG